MKHLVPVILIVLILAAVCMGREWQPFVAFSGLMDAPTEEVGYPAFHWRFETSKYLYPGTEFEAGIRKDKHEWYVGYHISHSPQLNGYSHDWPRLTDSSEIWHDWYSQTFMFEQRFMVGHRYWPEGARAAFSPFIGLGAEIGYSGSRSNSQGYQIEVTLDSLGNFSDYRRQQVSQYNGSQYDYAYGGLAELGCARRMWRDLDVALITQLHVYAKKYYDWGDIYHWNWHLMPTGVLQMRYNFR